MPLLTRNWGSELGKVFFETTETTETRETTTKLSIKMLSAVSVVPAVSKQLISREAHLTFQFSVFTFQF